MISALTGLDLPACATLLGLSCGEYLLMAQQDPRILGSLVTAGAVERTKRWLAAGSPAPDFGRLQYRGTDDVRTIVIEVLGRLPAPVAWHAAEYVVFIEVGRRSDGWQGRASNMREPAGDQPHWIVLSGIVGDENLRGVLAHELGHSWSSDVVASAVPPPTVAPMPERERLARLLAIGEPAERLVRACANEEELADGLAALWGFPFHSHTTTQFAREVDAAADLAQQINDEIERQLEGAA